MAQEYVLLNIGITFGLYVIVALSLNIEYGYGGIPNFGRAFAVLMGAFAAGGIVNRILIAYFNVGGDIVEASGEVKTIANSIIEHNPAFGIGILLLTLAIAAVIGAISGALFILPSAKLREDYLAITLLAISEVAFMVCYYDTGIIGGYYGVSVPDIFAFIPGEERLLVFTILTLTIAFLVFCFVERLLNTPYGRLLRAMRENEEVVRAYGKNIMSLRIKTVAIGSAIAAMAGVLYSYYSVNVIATSFSRVDWTFYPFLMLLLGGVANNRGVVLGVLSFVVAKVLLTIYKFEITAALNLPFEAIWLEYMMFGLVMLLILLYRPEGILKERPIMTEPIKKLAEKKN